MSGIFHSKAPLGSRVTRGCNIGIIADPFGENEVNIPSPESGVVIGRLNLPLVHRGDALFHIACVSKLTQVAETLEAFQEEFDGTLPRTLPVNPTLLHKSETSGDWIR
jgi:hypothetical protein